MQLGLLPDSVIVNEKRWEIRADYRNILRIIQVFNAEDLTNEEKLYVILKRFYADFEKLPGSWYGEAFKAETHFIEWQHYKEERATPQLVNWEKDEQLMFPAINKAAGMEVRALPFLHWWTFLGYFQSIDHDDLWGQVLTIRQKRARGKKLEKWERDFYQSNREMCAVDNVVRKTAEQTLEDMFNSLLQEGGDT